MDYHNKSVIAIVRGAYFIRVTFPELFGFIFGVKKRLDHRASNKCSMKRDKLIEIEKSGNEAEVSVKRSATR